jgi:alpha-tubulin suppressor-like RCC1 family protein
LALVTASDQEDGDVTANITIKDDGGFDPSTVGTYEITYEVVDSDGNEAEYALSVQVWNFVKLAMGQYFGMALGSNGSVWEWGYNSNGQLGDNTTTARTLVKQVAQNYFGNQPVIDIAGSSDTACAITAINAYCWGNGSYGGLGNGGTADAHVPTAVTMPSGVTFTQISGDGPAVTYSIFGALGSDGNIYTWGYGGSGTAAANAILGTGSTANALVPTKITTTGNFVQMSQGRLGGIAADNAGKVYVWGKNDHGIYGNGSTSSSNGDNSIAVAQNASGTIREVFVDGATKSTSFSDVKQVFASGYSADIGHVSVLLSSGQAYIWGTGYAYNGAAANRTSPTAVTGITGTIRYINGGSDYAQYVVDNDIWSVGYNDMGENFTGNTTTVTAPKKSTLTNIAGNVGMSVGTYSNAFILTPDGSTVYGAGTGSATYSMLPTGTNYTVRQWNFTAPTVP